MKLSDVVHNVNFNIQKNMYVGQLKDWGENYTHKYGYKLDFDVFLPSINKNLQRDFCWTLDQKRELILSILKDILILPMSVIIYTDKEDNKIFKVIDGKQRLSTLIDFIYDKFTVILNNQEFLFSQLPTHENINENIKYKISSFPIYLNQTYEYYDDLISDEDKINWFETLNFAGTKQDIEHLNSIKNLL